MTKVKDNKKAKSKSTFTKEQYLDWYGTMLLIRRFEEKAQHSYILQRKIRGFLHLCIGQEAVYAAMRSATRPQDAWITAYRMHGAAIARGITTKEAMAELYGRIDGNVKGKGGSMHFFKKSARFYGGHGIVGGQIGLGTGLAFADKYKGNDNITLCLFGDGAARQGILHESFNMAMSWKLPVLYICENNFYAMGTSIERTSNVTEMYKMGLGYDMPSKQIQGMDVVQLHKDLSEAADYVRKNGPMLLEIQTYRYRGHSMSDPAKYRTKAEEQKYKDIDPVKTLEITILEKGIASKDEIKAIKNAVKAEIEESVKFADASPFPTEDELYTDNYVQQDYPFIMD